MTRAAGFCRSRQSRHVSKGGAGAHFPPALSDLAAIQAELGRRVGGVSAVATRAGDGGGLAGAVGLCDHRR